MNTYCFKPTIENLQSSGEVFSTENGKGYFENGQLHIVAQNHFVYKNNGWYMRNKKTGVDFYLAQGACPTIQAESLEIANETLWNEILFEPEETPQEQGE